MKLVTATLCFLFLPFVHISAQESAAPEQDQTLETPRIVLNSPAYSHMCENFLKRIGGKKLSSGRISFRPRVLYGGEESKTGETWDIVSGEMPVSINSAELPDSLQKIRGTVAINIKRAYCFLRENKEVGRNDVALIMTTDEATMELDKILSSIKPQ